jgi:hypothetical protein
MKRSLLVFFLATLALGSLAPPATLAQGLNLYWNDCGGGTGAAISRNFACDTNTGDPFTMVLSVFPPYEMPQFVGVEARIDALVNSASLPPWWQTAVGQCRAGAVSATCDPNSFGALSCPDLWDGAPAVSASQVTSAPVSWGFIIRIAGAVQVPSPITAEEVGQELIAAVVRISRIKTVGAGACEGCPIGACFVASQVKLSQPFGVGDVILSYPAANNWVQLNGGTGNYNCYVPAMNRTWGAIKTLYR